MTLVLASTSPRRADLLREAGLAFSQRDPGVDDASEAGLAAEAQRAGYGPEGVVLRLAVCKLLAALVRAPEASQVLAADTVVVHGEALLGKPRDRGHAGSVLRALRGGWHLVLTGVALWDRGQLRTGCDTSRVEFRAFSEEELAAYLDTGLWVGKAAGYGVQDPASATLWREVVGSRSNVKGLPMELVARLLGQAGPRS